MSLLGRSETVAIMERSMNQSSSSLVSFAYWRMSWHCPGSGTNKMLLRYD